ncbi:MAG: hypothetical protein NUV77_21825, partial [Thermoguttaceae bacterium]|nr:hypothetical protein [Thermoguttaceae bacterium]
MLGRAVVAVWMAVIVAAGAARGSEAPSSPAKTEVPGRYDAIDAGRDAHFRGEQERLDAIGRQIETNDQLAWRAGQPTLYVYPPLDAVYAYGPRRAYRGAGAVPWLMPRYGYPAMPYLGVFEPWPLVPGDVYGYPYVARVPQPVGHQVVVIGPGAYLYRPIYALPALPGAPPAGAATPSQPAAPPERPA